MATKVEKREDKRKRMDGLSDRQKHIIELREQINKPDPHQVKTFTKYKIITYIFNVLFPPYALYRIWWTKSEFTHIEKLAQSFVAVSYTHLEDYFFKRNYSVILHITSKSKQKTIEARCV